MRQKTKALIWQVETQRLLGQGYTPSDTLSLRIALGPQGTCRRCAYRARLMADASVCADCDRILRP